MKNSICIAAHNSLDKANADFTCDGIDDQEEIQNAIDSLSTQGGIVYLWGGQFNISMPILVRSKITLCGMDENKLPTLFLKDAPKSRLQVKSRPGDTVLALKETDGFKPDMNIVIVSDKVRFTEKIKDIKKNKVSLYNDIKIELDTENVEIWSLIDVIKISNAKNASVSNIIINGNSEKQVSFRKGTSYLTIAGKKNNATDGNNAILINDGSENISVEKCYIYNTQAEGVFADNAGPHLRFINNKFENIGDKGIVTCRVSGPGIISRNHIIGAGKSENIAPQDSIWGWGDCINIHPDSGKQWIISDNILSQARRSGIRVTGASKSIISNNLINDCGDYGITAMVQHENIIKNNSIYNCNGGIVLAFPNENAKAMGLGGSIISENIVTDNKLHGIMCCGAYSCYISGNIIKRNKKYGLIITDKAYDEIDPSKERWPDYPVRGSGHSENIIISQNILSANGVNLNSNENDILIQGASNVKKLENLDSHPMGNLKH